VRQHLGGGHMLPCLPSVKPCTCET
jgi:hypothetical protein